MPIVRNTIAFLLLAQPAAASSLQTIFTFSGTLSQPSGPTGQILRDSSGNLYGAAYYGGASESGGVYELSPQSGGNYEYISLYQFAPGRVGVEPAPGLSIGPNGALFGATDANTYNENYGCGSVYMLPSGGTAMAVSRLNRRNVGCYANGPVDVGPNGDVYGMFQAGGGYYGAIMRFRPPANGRPHWSQQVLYDFTGRADGFYPEQPMLLSASGALFGTTLASSNGQVYPPPLFRLAPPAHGQTTWNFAIVHQFAPSECGDGTGQMVEGRHGVIYAPCSDNLVNGGDGPGDIFTLTPPAGTGQNWTLQVLYDFTGGADGGHPLTAVTLDTAGNVYGTTSQGHGTIFKLTPPASGQGPWTETTLWTFSGSDGDTPSSPLVLTPSGTLIGTTANGGAANAGTVFELTP